MRGSRRTLLSFSAFVLISSLMVLAPSAASAANAVIDSDPCPNSMTSLQPSRVTVAFAQDIPADNATIVVRNDKKADITNGAHTVEGNNVYANLPYPLPKGHYTAYYRVKDRDGTPFGGQFDFEYGNSNKMGNCYSPPSVGKRKTESTWRGVKNIPKIVALTGDKTSATAAAPNKSESATAEQPGDSETAKTADETSHLKIWLASLIMALLAAAGVTVIVRKIRA